MRVLLVGSGGREHALAWRLSQSPRLSELKVAGGNAGTAQLAENLPINPEDVDAVLAAAKSHRMDLVVVGPEVPLALGLADRLTADDIAVFGPTRAAARLESSKGFAREIMAEAGVPSPGYRVFQDPSQALEYVRSAGGPIVVKADGLAAGKGVVVCPDPPSAEAAVRACMHDRAFGSAGDTVVIEEFLSGVEVSVFAFCDGQEVSEPVAASDYKTIGDNGQGPNTGGMGSFTPPVAWSQEFAREVTETVLRPTAQVMARHGSPFRGVFYAGLMLTGSGPKVLEFNCRFGDPEAQVILPLLASDPIDVMVACARGGLAQTPVEWSRQPHVGVVMVSGGYPGRYQTGFPIAGLESDAPNSRVFHAGTRLEGEGKSARAVTSGGRVLTVVGWGDTVAAARERAYARLAGISFEGAYYRTDIALPAGDVPPEVNAEAVKER